MAAERIFLLLAAFAAAFMALAPGAAVASHDDHEHNEYPIANVTIADFANYLVHEFATDVDGKMMTLEDFERMMVATGVLVHADDEHDHGHGHEHEHEHEHNNGFAHAVAAPEARRQQRSRHRPAMITPIPTSAADLEELAKVPATAPPRRDHAIVALTCARRALSRGRPHSNTA